MAKKTKSAQVKSIIKPERINFLTMLAKNPNYFGNIPGSKIKPNLKMKNNIYYEEISCIGYNPSTQILEATFTIKSPVGYSGNLCTSGSNEYVRFYIDFHDGAGWIDQGSAAVNVHDIPEAKDCFNNSILPLSYTASLKKKNLNFSNCDSPLLPRVRAILSWNFEPPANSPDWPPVWGNVKEADIQLKPFFFLLDDKIKFKYNELISLAVQAPNLSFNQIAQETEIQLDDLKPVSKTLSLNELSNKYIQSEIDPSRFAYKAAVNMIKYPASEITLNTQKILNELKIDYTKLIDKFSLLPYIDKTKANVDWEELECVGLDYNSENLVATIKIKKNNGYSGDLCDAGSKEYVAFWIDWNNDCKWEYLNTVQLDVHDLKIPAEGLFYSLTLPLDTTFHKKLCSNPNLVRVRGVLSWNQLPSTTDPNLLQYYGNRVDSHIQIKPGTVLNPGDVQALFNIIGGIPVDKVNDVTGLTTAGAFFAYNGIPVPSAAPFGGVIVINGPTFAGNRYRIKVRNTATNVSYYLNDSFTVVGWLPVAPYVQYTTQTPDVNGYYNFLPVEKNTLSILARFTPGTNDKLEVTMEVESVLGTFSKTIQMDNIAPQIALSVDDGGDCTHYHKGDTITGHYYVFDANLLSYNFGSTFGGGISGTSNTLPLPGNSFGIPTNAGSNPCGSIYLHAVDKTIRNSQSVGFEVWTNYNICLQGN
jgi:hypothetical protein